MQAAKTYWLGEKDFSYTLGMDPIRSLILKRADEMDENLASLSRKMGKSHSYLQQFIQRGVPRELKERDRIRLAQLIEVDQEEIGGPVGSTPIEMPLQDSAEPPRNARIAGPLALGFTVPVYGQAAGGPDGRFILNGNKIDDILAPTSLAGVRNAYAVYVHGTSMEPRYHPGEAVFVHPGLPVRKNDYVVVQIKGEEGSAPDGYVKRFISQDARYLSLLQLHPRKVLKFPSQKVHSVHRIVMGGDG